MYILKHWFLCYNGSFLAWSHSLSACPLILPSASLNDCWLFFPSGLLYHYTTQLVTHKYIAPPFQFTSFSNKNLYFSFLLQYAQIISSSLCQRKKKQRKKKHPKFSDQYALVHCNLYFPSHFQCTPVSRGTWLPPSPLPPLVGVTPSFLLSGHGCVVDRPWCVGQVQDA